MPNKKKLYEALKAEGYDNFADESSFNAYVDNADNRKKLFSALKQEGYDNFADETEFEKYLGYNSEDNAAFEANAERFRNGQPIERVTTQSVVEANPDLELGGQLYQYKPEVQEHILKNKPDMFKPKQSLMDAPLGVNAPEGSDEKFQARIDVAQKNLQDPEYQKGKVKSEFRVLSDSVNADLEEIEDAITSRQKAVRNIDWKPGMPSSRDDSKLTELRGQRTYLEGAKELIEDSQNILNAVEAEKDGSFFGGLGRGVRDKAFDIDTWTMGLSDLVGGLRLKSVLDKAEKGETLTPAEQKLLDASVNNMAVNFYYRNDLGLGYQAGEITGQSIPFMLEFLVNPVSASGNAMAKRLLTYGLKRFGSAVNSKAIKAGTRLATDALAAGGVTATTGMGNVLSGGVERLNRNYEYGLDEEGNLNVVNTHNMGVGEAFAKSATSAFLERQSEMIFNAFRGAPSLFKGIETSLPGGVNTFMNYVSNSRLGELWRGIKNNATMNELAKRTQFHGLGEEYLEEVYNNFANIPLGEMTFEEATDLENNIVTFLGLAPTQVMFSAIGGIGYGVERYKAKRDLERTFGKMTEEQKRKLIELQEMGKLFTNKDIAFFLAETIKDESLTPEQKRAEIEYAYNLVKQNAIDEVSNTDVEDTIESENVAIDAVTNLSTGEYIEVDRWVVDAETGVRVPQPGNIVGWIGEAPVFVPEGMENAEENRIVLKPNEWNPETIQRRPAEEVKAINEEMIREEAAQQAELEAKYAPEVLNAQMPEGEFTMGGQLFVPSQVTSDGVVYDIFDLNEKGKPTTTIPIETRPVAIDEYRDMLQAQLNAEEAAQKQLEEQAAAPEVVEEVQPTEEVRPIVEGVATQPQAAQPKQPTLEEVVASLPKTNKGEIDYKAMTPQQQYQYTSITESPEVALEDLQADITAGQEEIVKKQEKLTKAKGGERAALRDEVRKLTQAQAELQAFYESVAPKQEAVAEEAAQPVEKTETESVTQNEKREAKQRGSVGTPVALAYLLEGGRGSIENLGYFLHGVAGAFPELENELETIRGNIGDKLGVAPDRFAEVAPNEMAEMRSVIESKYGEEGAKIFDELVSNAIGYYPREGANMAKRIDDLKPIEQNEEQNEQKHSVETPVSEEEQRRKPLRERAKEWSKALGVKVTYLESIDDVDADTRREIEAAHAKGKSVPGWVNKKGEVFFFMPDLSDLKDVDDTYIHEVVAHVGLPQLLGKERFGELCDKVWEMMPQSAKDYYMSYPGVKNHRDAADEYIAHLAEQQNLTPEEKTIWDNIVKMFREMLDKALNGIISKSKLTDEDISNLIKASYANLKSGVEGGAANAETNRMRAVERLEESVGEVDAEKGDVRFAVRDVLKGEERAQAIKDLMAVTGRSKKTVEKWLKAEDSLASVILNEDNVGILDMEADESVPSIWKNSDYPQGTVEFSNICKKRLPFTTIYQRLQKEFPDTLFDAQTLNTIRNTMKEMGEDVACALCFVEDRRQLLGEIGQGFIDAVKGMDVELNDKQKVALDKLRESGDKYVPNLFDIITLDGMKELRKKHPEVAQAFIEYNNARGMQSGRLFQAYSAYNREILKYNKKKVESINNNGGLRIFSFSDFEAHHLIDLVQVLTDCAAKGIKVQGYTKVPEFAKAVKGTNAKINRSLIPKGVGYVDADYTPKEGEAVSPNVINGKRLLFDTIEGIDVNNPNFFDSTNSKSVGNILVAINDEHARLAMADPFVDYIIGFHTGQSKAILKGKGIDTWVNYKNEQLDKEIVTDENGNQKMKNAPHHGLNIYTDVLNVAEAEGNPIKTAKQFTERFIEECNNRGWIPRFHRFLNRAKDGRFLYTPGYHKFLIDFKLFDKNGRILPQEAVVPVFDNAFNKQILDDYVKGVKEEMPNDAVYEAVKDAIGLGEGTRFSVKDAVVANTEKDNLPTSRKEALKKIDELRSKAISENEDGLPYFINHETNNKFFVSNADARHTMMYHNIDQIKIIGVYDKIINKATFVGDLDVDTDEISTTKRISKYECPVIIDDKQYLADMTAKEYNIGQYMLDEVHLYDTKLKDDDSAPSASANNGLPVFNSQSSSSDNKGNNSESEIQEKTAKFRVISDKKLIDKLENEPKIKVYRAMQLIDGKLYPPMSAKVDGKMREPIELGKWEMAEERPDLADEKGYFKLDKGNKSSLKARYNPYIHTSTTPLNDQFSSAQSRPELVTVEVEVPKSELTSGYKAEKAKDAVGKVEWKAGVVQGKLSGTRTVILSRYDKPIRIVPDSEVADEIVKMFDGKDITMPSNVVTPSLRAELEKRGVPFVETDNQGKAVGTRFRVKSFETANGELDKDGISINNKELMDEYGLSDITLSKSGNHVTLSKVVVEDKGKGNGTRFMEDLTNNADNNGWILALTPDTSFGGSSVASLKKFYKRFGFKDNKGRNTDFETRESMVRPVGGTRFRVTPQQDKDYLEAVNSGNLSKAQQMVDEVLERAGYTIRGEHGTTHKFTIFSNVNANIENSFGKGFYFTSDINDAEKNYASDSGADLTNRIELLAERMEFEDGYEDMSYEERVEEAKNRLQGGENLIISAAIRMENPCIFSIDPEGTYKETIFEAEEAYDEETDEYSEPEGNLVDFVNSLQNVLDIGEYWGADNVDTYELLSDGYYTADQLKSKMDEMLMDVQDEEGNMASSEIFRAALEGMGFDGIIDNAPSHRFKGMGLSRETKHYIAFSPNQIKQSDAVTSDNDGNVIPLSQRANIENDDIRFRLSEKGKQIQAEVDKFTSKYNSKPVRIVEAEMDDNELMEALDNAFELEDVKSFMAKSKTAAGYFHNLDKIIIFADRTKVERMEEYLFHENIHAAIHHNNFSNLVAHFYEYAKDEAVFEKWSKLAHNKEYKQYNSSEEFLAYVLSNAMVARNLDDVAEYLEDKQKESLNKLFNVIGYDYDIRRRSNEQSGNGRTGEGTPGESSLEGDELLNTGEGRGIGEGTGESKGRKISPKERKARLNELFGKVADMGLQGILGNKEYTSLMVDIYKALPEEVRADIAEDAIRLYGGSVAPAVSDYIGPKSKNSIMDKVVTIVREALRKIGFDLDLNANEVRYMAWRSKKTLDRNNMLEVAEDIDMKYRLKVGEYDGTTPDGGGTRFRVANKLQVRDEYESTIKKGGYQAREAVQDAMLSLRKFQELIEKASGKKIRDFENAWMHENRLSSVVQAEIHDMERKFYKPMMDAVKKLMKAANLEQEQVAGYLMLKHGIERNREMAVRKALTDDKGKIDRTQLEQWYQDKEAIRNDASLDTWRKKQEAMDNAALNYGADMSRDYSGLTSMFDTDDIEECTNKAYDEVEALENAHPAETESLGKAIKAMTQNTLDKSFESGLMDRKVYNELSKDMYDYYIPLRGFEETTSDEVYAYLDQDRGAFNAPLKRAKGRSSKSDNPIAYLKSIAESGIMQGERNKMKQSFLNMVINHPSDLVSVREGVWVTYNPATGEWEVATPPAIPNDATPADVEAAMEAWEQQMEQAAQNDPTLVKKVAEAADVPYRVVGNKMDQHQIIVKRLGKSYALTINGNPRLAMALNGQTNPNNTSNDGKVAAFVNNKIGSINRSLAAWYTTRNPDFVASNFMRDTFYTNTIVRAKEGNAYANKFHKNYAMVLPKMLGLFRKYENGTLEPANKTEAAFLDFMMNGGETGYSNLKDVEEIKKQISKELKGNRFAKVEALAEKLDILNRAVENTARFAAYLTSREEGRSIAKSIFDAKEISVNFNKKGAGGTFFGMTGQTWFGNLAAMVGASGRALYVFFNAAIQGSTNLMHVMKVNPKGTSAGLAAMFLMGAVVPFLFGGDDDDEKDYYDLPEHVRRNHLIVPGAGDAWVSIPLPIEYRIMYGIGELLTSWRTGHERGTDIARKMLSMTGQALPLNFLEEGLEAFVPSAVSPIYQVMTNSSWTGLPIYKENDFNKDDPEYTKAYSNVDRNLLKFTKALYEWSFDEENQKERIDLNPAIIETLAKGYFGGLATQLSNLAKVGGMIAGEQEFDWRNIPIGNRILKTGDERTKEKRVTNEYFENMEKLDFLQSRERMLKKTEKGVAVPETDKFKAQKDLETMQGTEVYKKYQEFKKQKKAVDKIRKTIKEKGSTPEREKQLMEAQEAANKSVR